MYKQNPNQKRKEKLRHQSCMLFYGGVERAICTLGQHNGFNLNRKKTVF